MTSSTKNWPDIQQGAYNLGIMLPEQDCQLLSRFMEQVLRVNRSLNLTRIPAEQFVALHILDSLAILTLPCCSDIKPGSTLLDLGTGAGFPGVPLAIAAPKLQVTLLDARQKRIAFLAGALNELGLSQVMTLHARAELLAHDHRHRDSYSFVVARAVAELSVLLELAAGFLANSGYLICPKGPEGAAELVGLEDRIKELGLISLGYEERAILGSSRCHRYYLFQKIALTPARFPRSFKKLGSR